MVKRKKKMKWRVGVEGSVVEPWYILHMVFLVPEPTKDRKIDKPAVHPKVKALLYLFLQLLPYYCMTV